MATPEYYVHSEASIVLCDDHARDTDTSGPEWYPVYSWDISDENPYACDTCISLAVEHMTQARDNVRRLVPDALDILSSCDQETTYALVTCASGVQVDVYRADMHSYFAVSRVATLGSEISLDAARRTLRAWDMQEERGTDEQLTWAQVSMLVWLNSDA